MTTEDRYEAQHQSVLIIHTLIEFDDQYLATQVDIISALKHIWSTDLYKVCGIELVTKTTVLILFLFRVVKPMYLVIFGI